MENKKPTEEQEAHMVIFIIIAMAAGVLLISLIGDVLNQLGGY